MIERVTIWVCDECDYWRLEQRSGVHVTANPDDPNGRMVTHNLKPVVFVREASNIESRSE